MEQSREAKAAQKEEKQQETARMSGQENKGIFGWSPWKSASGQKKGFHLKKDQLLIGLLTGILLIVIALPVDQKQEQTKNAQGTDGTTQVGETKKTVSDSTGEGSTEESMSLASSDSYTREMEARLAKSLSLVEGVGNVQVLITWKTSSEKVVEKDQPGTSQTVEETDASGGQRTTVEESIEETTVYQEGEDGSRMPYVIKEIKPQAEGVLVIAQGGGDPAIAQNILEAVQALFPLDTHKIKIMKMEGSK